jgi:hypothetical protein
MMPVTRQSGPVNPPQSTRPNEEAYLQLGIRPKIAHTFCWLAGLLPARACKGGAHLWTGGVWPPGRSSGKANKGRVAGIRLNAALIITHDRIAYPGELKQQCPSEMLSHP